MRIIHRARQCGKTTELIKISSEKNAPIIVLTRNHAKDIERKAQELGLRIPAPIPLNCLIASSFNSLAVPQVCFDDLDSILSSLVNGAKILAVSLTQKAHCSNCDREVDYVIKSSVEQGIRLGVLYSYERKRAYCPFCNHSLEIPELEKQNNFAADDAYDRKRAIDFNS